MPVAAKSGMASAARQKTSATAPPKKRPRWTSSMLSAMRAPSGLPAAREAETSAPVAASKLASERRLGGSSAWAR